MTEVGDRDWRGDSMSSSGGETNFSSKSLGLRAQKKLLGKMSSRNVAKHFIDDRTGHLLDEVYRLLKGFYNKKEAEKVVKAVIKMTIKVGILLRNEQLSVEEEKVWLSFQRKFNTLTMTILSFCQVEYSYDRLFLKKLLGETEGLMVTLVQPHLSDKSIHRVHFIFAHFGKEEFLDAVFKHPSRFPDLRTNIVNNLASILDQAHT